MVFFNSIFQLGMAEMRIALHDIHYFGLLNTCSQTNCFQGTGPSSEWNSRHRESGSCFDPSFLDSDAA